MTKLILLFSAVVLAGNFRAVAAELAAGPVFRYYLVGGYWVLSADQGTPFHEDLFCILRTEDNSDPVRGAEAYSFSLGAEGVSISEITVSGTSSADVHDDPPGSRDGGFERSELTIGGVGACEGLAGAVSTVVLSNSSSITLPPNGGQVVARLKVDGAYPAKGETLHARIRFADGCKGSGEPVLNRVRYAGSWLEPIGEDFAIDLRAWPDCPSSSPDDTFQVIFQSKSTWQTPELFAGLAPTPDPAAPAEIIAPPRSTTVYAAIVSQLPPGSPGLQGWSLSLSLTGDITLVGATTAGTAAARVTDNPPGLRRNGFEVTSVVNPNEGSGGHQGQGAVSAVVLSVVDVVTLAPSGTASVLSLTLEGEDGQAGQLIWKNGLQGRGEPVDNSATLGGESRHFDCFQKANVRFETPVKPFHRGDLNNDGRIDITDAIRLLNFLFRGGSQPPCMDAADFNDDGKLDLSDAVSSLVFKFGGGPRPSSPGPPQDPCGIDPEPHLPAGCAEYTRC